MIVPGNGYLLIKARIINPLQEFVSCDYPCSVPDRLHLITAWLDVAILPYLVGAAS